jgi:predicted PolB exonuclease-like 3'-5' exonuclease
MQTLRNLKEDNLLFYDVETVRIAESFEKLSQSFKDAWLYKARHFNEQSRKSGGADITPEQFFKDKAALYAPFSKIVCIVLGKIDGNTLKIKTYQGDEKELLTKFAQDLTQSDTARKGEAIPVGFNNIGFDGPLLTKRMLVNDVLLPGLLDNAHLKPWEVRGVDLSKLWQGTSFYPDSLNAVAAALGLSSPKGDMDGSEVSEAFYKGEIDKIVSYCVGDVLTTANIYRRFLQKQLLSLT